MSQDVEQSGRTVRPNPAIGASEFRKVTVTRLTDEVVDQIRRLIIVKGLSEGARLPSERALAEALGASRPTVSQALRILAVMGLVEIRPGSGAYVVQNPESMVTASVNLMLDLRPDSVFDLAQLRGWLEQIGAAEATRVASDEQIVVAERALGKLWDAGDRPSMWIAADTLFHSSVVKAAHNLYLTAAFESVHNAVVSFGYSDWVEHDESPPWLLPDHIQEQYQLHEAILRALQLRDEQAITRAVKAHHDALETHLRLIISTTP